MKRLLAFLNGSGLPLAALFCSVLLVTGAYSCTSDLRAEGFSLRLVAAPGDSLKVVSGWRVTGGPVDSIVWTVQSPRTITVRRREPGGAASDTATIVPGPFLAPGDSLLVTATLQAWKGTVPSALATATAMFRRAPAITFDSLKVTGLILKPDTAVVQALGSRQFCVFLRNARGDVLASTQAEAVWPECSQYTVQLAAFRPRTTETAKLYQRSDSVTVTFTAEGGTITT